MRLILSLLCLVSLLASAPASACGPEVRIRFLEASPDQFQIQFLRGPKLKLAMLTIDLTNSAAGAVFDDFDAFALQGPQPNPQGVTIRSIDYRTDGRETATIVFDGFLEKRAATLHSDLDDTGLAADRDQNHLYEGELEGASARATMIADNGRRIEIEGGFDKSGHAILGSRACV